LPMFVSASSPPLSIAVRVKLRLSLTKPRINGMLLDSTILNSFSDSKVQKVFITTVVWWEILLISQSQLDINVAHRHKQLIAIQLMKFLFVPPITSEDILASNPTKKGGIISAIMRDNSDDCFITISDLWNKYRKINYRFDLLNVEKSTFVSMPSTLPVSVYCHNAQVLKPLGMGGLSLTE